MRLDIRNEHDAENMIRCVSAHVTFNGAHENVCLMCDDETGEMLRFKKGIDNKLIYNRETKDAETETIYGVVVITFPNGLADGRAK